MVLEDYFYVGVSLCRLCGFNIFGMQAVFGVDVCRLFPRCVLAVIPLIGGVTGVGPETALNVEGGLPSARWVLLPSQRPVCGSRRPQILSCGGR